ncbi:hypothetical protein C8Q70DRAFT_1053254 [Cubamyces menziesii]|uniref:Uncharacterized protein n=1 Tax=Trametes cubensis TaxID=1111947 RepID=A0AAD7XHE3_9APHY|nr:hypothetical protein C8Q70DRAFT_1053254 [Cubamyces menziesii]KAJ8495512.1 hypothetical protein ONZ51_g1671 [Trametes cubensis]
MQFSTLVKLAFVVTNIGAVLVSASALEARVAPDAACATTLCTMDPDSCPVGTTCTTVEIPLLSCTLNLCL